MLDRIDLGRTFETAQLERPFGRGCNLQIEVDGKTLPLMLDKLAAAGTQLVLAPEERWYAVGKLEHGQRQFIVADPDGYLLRFMTDLGDRRIRS